MPVLDCGSVFKDCDLHKVGVLSTPIEEMDASSLNYWLSKFVMEIHARSKKVCRKNNPRPPKTVYGIVCGICCYLEKKK